MDSSADSAVAIVGLGAILPDAASPAEFWQNLLARRYSISETPPDRWSIEDYYDPDPTVPDKTYSKIGGWVRGFEFDWKKHRMPPRVVAAMDQAQQWAVTVADQALADYGYPQRPLDTERTGVILGTTMGGELHYLTHLRISFPEFRRLLESVPEFRELPAETRAALVDHWRAAVVQAAPSVTEDSMPGELPNIVAGRVANVLNLRGPNYIADAACASSCAAVAVALELLVQHRVDAVITGGTDRNMGASSFVKFCKIGALSATGSRPFGEGADGFVMGEGAAAFLLKRLDDAERAGDRIYAVIRGVGAASDGKGKGITAPNPIGQQLAMQRAWQHAGLDPETVSLIEAHGTSTRVGDVVEVESLRAVFGAAAPHSIGLGSVKSNMGHLKAGAGAAGLLKSVLALYHKTLPPTLNCERPNPDICLERTPFYLVQQASEWQPKNGVPRRCGTSAYGFGGTNFHIVLEEYVPGMLAGQKVFAVAVPRPASRLEGRDGLPASAAPSPPVPVRGILAVGAAGRQQLEARLHDAVQVVQGGWTPPPALPDPADIRARERVVIDFGDRGELLDRLQKALKAMALDNPQAWRALQQQGVFYGSGPAPGKIAFLFPGQGSQYLNMGRELASRCPVVAEVLADADRVMTPVVGRPLTQFIFFDGADSDESKRAEKTLTRTEYCQPAMLTLDTAMFRLLDVYGFRPDLVMGHSLGEYAALIAAGALPFDDALRAAAARGTEMSKVSLEDNGWMAAVMAPYECVEQTLKEMDGYVVAANINSYSQCVIGGASHAVEKAIADLRQKGIEAQRIPVSHAFHTRIVAPAGDPLRKFLDTIDVRPPALPLVANVTGDFYPRTAEEIKDLLRLQVASPVQWVKGLETLYAAGARTFVEVGPKKALKGFVDDVLGGQAGVVSLFTNHPKFGELPSFNQALCGLYAAGYGAGRDHSSGSDERAATRPESPAATAPAPRLAIAQPEVEEMQAKQVSGNGAGAEVLQSLAQVLEELAGGPHAALPRAFDRNAPPLGSIVISGTGLGLPGAGKPVMDPDNALRILRGEQFIDLFPERFRKKILAKRITRLVKGEDGSGRFEVITDADEVIRLAGRGGSFDLSAEYGVPDKLVKALDITSQMAMAAGLDALREAGIPLVQTYRRATTGKYLPDRWLLPEALRDETGVIFASAAPGLDRFADELERYFAYQGRVEQLKMLEELRMCTNDDGTLVEIARRMNDLREQLAREPYEFDRRFLFRMLSMGHSQFAEYIGARGPNTHVNAACASTTQAIALAEDWIRDGRARRVIVIGADDVSSDHLMEWVGAGFLATGAVATDDRVEEAALPFDRRRHGTIIGMGACALVVESEDAVRERGMRGIVELLASETNNSAYHGTRLDLQHIAAVMNNLLTSVERRFGLNRYAVAPHTVFMSHETYTPARGGSASAEVVALRQTFGDVAGSVIVANTKGFTGHPMGVGIEDVIAVKILEHGIVPPVPNYREMDPDLGTLNLSRGGRYPVQYALHLAAGFGSQLAMTFTRRIPGALDRLDNRLAYDRWLSDASGYDRAETEVVSRVLRIKAAGAPPRPPAPGNWRLGTGPILRSLAAGDGAGAAYVPVPRPAAQAALPVPAPLPVHRPAEPAEPARGGNGRDRATPKPAEPGRGGNGHDLAASEGPRVEAAAPEPVSVAPAGDALAERVLALVAAKTGYPRDMLDLDLDLEADLGIDTVKQAETFAAIREEFNIPRVENLKLRDYPTLRHVIGFVHKLASFAPLRAPTEPPPAAPEPKAPASPSVDPVTGGILDIVVAKTGYPKEMLDLDLDLEADLGIDTVKQAETFAAIREAFDIPRQENLRLRDYPTLAHVIQFVRGLRPDLGAAPAAPVETGQVAPAVPAVTTPPPEVGDPIAAKVLEIVAAKTGYPTEMLDLDLDLEADLGVDTVKQAETFIAIREAFDIPRPQNLKLRDYPTLAHVIGFVREQARKPAVAEPAETPAAAAAPSSSAARAQPLSIDDANRIPRRIPVPVLRPPLPLCKPTGITLDATSRVIVMLDAGGEGQALVDRLRERGVTALVLPEPPAAEALAAQINAWLGEGAIHGVYWLPALDVEPDVEELSLEQWRELNRVRVKNLYVALRTLYESVQFAVVATRLGGLHGYGEVGATAPLGGAVTGFAKAFKRERPQVVVKAVDFGAAFDAEALLAETLYDPGVVEVGYRDGMRYGIALQAQAAGDEGSGMKLDASTVFVVTGAAGGITSAIVADLAAASGGVFYLLDLVPSPDPADPHIALFRQDKEALKQKLIEEARARGERPKPAQIDKHILAVERQEAALRAVESVQAAGGTPFYHSVNLLDAQAVAAVIDRVREQQGRIDVVVHAGGMEISRALPDKDPKQFDLVFDVKADGFFNLLRAARGLPIGATVVFSSVAGRFGNAGQTDYSAANDLLCKVTSSLRRWRPETRGIAIDWTAWSGIGMATRGSIPKIMEMAGIDMLPPECGVPTVRRELTCGAARGEVVVAGRLGVLTDETDAAGGLDVDKANAWLAERRLPMIGKVTAARLYDGVQVETTLDPKMQPFLYDHAMDGVPLLPGVMGIEGMAEIAGLLAPGYCVAAVEDVQYQRAFKFHRMQPQTLYLSAVIHPAADGELVARAAIRSVTTLARGEMPAQEKVHFTATVRLARTAPGSPVLESAQPVDGDEMGKDEIYRLYFHGPAYQVLDRVTSSGHEAAGWMAEALPPDVRPADATLLVAPRLIELVYQTVGIWEIKQGRLALPLGVGAVRTYRQPAQAGGRRLVAMVEAVDGGAAFNGRVVDDGGAVYVELTDYRTVSLPG